jgi:hypothetical protein
MTNLGSIVNADAADELPLLNSHGSNSFKVDPLLLTEQPDPSCQRRELAGPPVAWG